MRTDDDEEEDGRERRVEYAGACARWERCDVGEKNCDKRRNERSVITDGEDEEGRTGEQESRTAT